MQHVQEKFSIYHCLCTRLRIPVFRDASSQMRNIGSIMQSPCCVFCKDMNIVRYLKFFSSLKNSMPAYSASPPVCHFRIPHGCFHIIDNREPGNTNVDCWSSLGLASSDSVLTVQVCNFKESTSLTVHYYFTCSSAA